KGAEDTVAIDDDAPGVWNADFDAAEHGGDLECGGIARHNSPAEIDLVAAEYGIDMAAGEILHVDLALASAEHRRFPQASVDVQARADAVPRGAFDQHHEAGADEDQRPKVVQADVQIPHGLAEKDGAHANVYGPGDVTGGGVGIHQLDEPEGDQNHRPVAGPFPDIEDVQVVEPEQHA